MIGFKEQSVLFNKKTAAKGMAAVKERVELSKIKPDFIQ